MRKVCSKCKIEKDSGSFSKNNYSKDGLQSRCKICCAESQRKWHKNNPDKVRAGKIKYNFGISRLDYEALHKKQGGVCAICSKPETAIRNGKLKELAIDHCHQTGQVRGLLCQRCNTALGQFSDDISTLESAINYLRV